MPFLMKRWSCSMMLLKYGDGRHRHADRPLTPQWRGRRRDAPPTFTTRGRTPSLPDTAERRNSLAAAWILLLMAILYFGALFLVRSYPFKAQERHQTVLSTPLARRIPEFSEAQLIALRFAADGELPALVDKVLATNMPAREIKKNIVARRADTFRV
jgi:hypothetical protein